MNDLPDPAASPDEALLQKVADGDRGALALLVRRHQKKVLHLAFRTMLNWDDAEDVAQEAFIRVWRAAGRFEPSARFATWLYRIVINLCLDQKRAAARKRTIQSDPQDALDAHSAANTDPAAPMEQAELARRIERAIAALSERQRVAIVLHRYEGLSHPQIAETTGWSRSAVESLLVRAYANLRTALADLTESQESDRSTAGAPASDRSKKGTDP